MPSSFFEDYNFCVECGFDHEWNREEAVEMHRQILEKKARELQMETKVETLDLPKDPQAYVFAAMAAALVIAFMAAIYWCW